MNPEDIIAQIELPSSNKPVWIHQFMEEVNRSLASGGVAHLDIDWRSNRRFLTIVKGAAK